MAIVKDLIHTDTDKELEEQEQEQGITNSPEEHDNEIDRQEGPGRDDGYVPEATPEQGEVDRVPAEEAQEEISANISKDMDWER